MNRDLALRKGITRLAIGWAFAILFTFLLLGGGLILVTTQLDAMARRLFTDAASLDTEHVLELTILAQGRADLLRCTTGDDRYRQVRNDQLAEIDRSISDLWVNVTSSEEKALVEAVVVQYQAFRHAAATDSPQDPERLLPLVDSLLEAIHRHRDLNARQMADTLSLSTTLNERVDATSLTLILLTAAVLSV